MQQGSEHFQRTLEEVLGIEGGFVDDPADSGGATNWGITEAKARQWGYDGPMDKLPRQLAVRIYHKDYWRELQLDDVCHRASYEIAAELMDTAVNMGARTAGMFLQRCLRTLNRGGRDYPDIAADGIVGNLTLIALSAFAELRGEQGLHVLLTALNCLQGAAYIRLAERREKDERFLYGWLAQRVRLPF